MSRRLSANVITICCLKLHTASVNDYNVKLDARAEREHFTYSLLDDDRDETADRQPTQVNSRCQEHAQNVAAGLNAV